jgi:hypothetical protein
MTTVDKLLLKVLNQPSDQLINVPSRDIKVLKSLGKIVSGNNFITENQGRLLLKILSENSEKFGDLKNEVIEDLKIPTWSKPFRSVDKTKKVYTGICSDGTPLLTIEFAFSSTIRKLLHANFKKISGIAQHTNGRIYTADLTEKNIVTVMELLDPYGFEFDEKIHNFYNTIKLWSEIEVKSQFLISNISHTNFQRHITADLGINTPLDDNIINDRAVRYQYFVEKSEKIPENLTEKIAYREKSKVWVNRKQYELADVFTSLLKLKRLPALVIFDYNDHKKCLEELAILNDSLEKNRIFDNVGIYFRLPNDEYGAEFNKFIADHQYNVQLDQTTKIVGVQNGKIPKFFLKNDWKPMSVIAIGSSLKQTKTAVYANCCDLIISYTDSQPIIETRTVWE